MKIDDIKKKIMSKGTITGVIIAIFLVVLIGSIQPSNNSTQQNVSESDLEEKIKNISEQELIQKAQNLGNIELCGCYKSVPYTNMGIFYTSKKNILLGQNRFCPTSCPYYGFGIEIEFGNKYQAEQWQTYDNQIITIKGNLSGFAHRTMMNSPRFISYAN